MKWLRIGLYLMVLCTTLVLPVGLVSADLSSNINISVYATPFTGGIASFTVTYITDTDMRLDWTTEGEVLAVMIRAQYGRYPNDIPNVLTAPSDGYLVYSGNGTQTHDTSMNFDENPGGLYYAIWAQHLDGTWFLPKLTGWKESKAMALLALLIFAVGMTWVGSRSTYYILKVLAGFSWILVMAYWIANPPGTITAGSSAHTIGIIVFIGIAAAMFFFPMWYPKIQNGQEIGGRFRLPFMRTDEGEEEERRRRRIPSRQERVGTYYDRLDAASRGERRRARG